MHYNLYKIISNANNVWGKMGQQSICPICPLLRDKIIHKITRVTCNNSKLAKNQPYNIKIKTMVLK